MTQTQWDNLDKHLEAAICRQNQRRQEEIMHSRRNRQPAPLTADQRRARDEQARKVEAYMESQGNAVKVES